MEVFSSGILKVLPR